MVLLKNNLANQMGTLELVALPSVSFDARKEPYTTSDTSLVTGWAQTAYVGLNKTIPYNRSSTRKPQAISQ